MIVTILKKSNKVICTPVHTSVDFLKPLITFLTYIKGERQTIAERKFYRNWVSNPQPACLNSDKLPIELHARPGEIQTQYSPPMCWPINNPRVHTRFWELNSGFRVKPWMLTMIQFYFVDSADQKHDWLYFVIWPTLSLCMRGIVCNISLRLFKLRSPLKSSVFKRYFKEIFSCQVFYF